ncbi:MAG TPA: SRPBCC family protein [Bauldia sp.]|nr:SRPBCC family protein [Bauldia sp.]
METTIDGGPPPADAKEPPTSRAGKVLRWLGIAIVAVVALAIIVAFFLPRHAVVARSTEVAAPPSAVFAIVSDLRRFNEWSPWADIDPETVYTFTGPIDGVGQTLNWESSDERVGAGSMSIAGLEPDRRVDLAIDFGDRGTALASLVLDAAGPGTKVTWNFDSDLGFNPIARYFGMMMDGMIGPDYEKGLARLKAVAEAPPAVADEPAR